MHPSEVLRQGLPTKSGILLSSIKGFATFFKERYRDNPEDRKTAEIMVQEVERLNRVIGQLLEFARPMEMNRQRTSINEVIRHTLKMIEGETRERKDRHPHGSLPRYRGCPDGCG